MSRLIEAGKILDNLSGMLKNMDDYDAVKKVINDMPTAYDVDAVVEQLEDYSDADEAEGTIPVIELTKAIEIVKGGGVDDKDCAGDAGAQLIAGVDDNPNSNNDYRPDM